MTKTYWNTLSDPDEPTPETGETKSAQPPVNEVETRLLNQRKVLIFGSIDDKLAREVTARVLLLASESADPIDVFINSPGGHVESGDTIHDILRFVRASVPVRVIGTGWVASAGALIYLAGERGRRFALPNTRFLLHQPMGGIRGQATDIGIEAKEMMKTRARLNALIARETGQTLEKVEKDTDRNYWMSAEEAREYGIVDRVISVVSDLG
ncbi:MAG: ATP-dependent Clp protease proteolytic subunit [Alphaproteobacteria bacterium]